MCDDFRSKILSRRSRKNSRNNNNARNGSTKYNIADKIDDDDNVDDDDEEEEEEEDPQKDNNDVRIHQKDNRCSRKRPRQGLQNVSSYDDEIWMGMFEKFVAYKNQHKNTIVPRRYDEDPKLGWWVSSQRKAYKNDMLLPNQSIYARLNSVGFKWVGG